MPLAVDVGKQRINLGRTQVRPDNAVVEHKEYEGRTYHACAVETTGCPRRRDPAR